jgi:DNA primase small subunit
MFTVQLSCADRLFPYDTMFQWFSYGHNPASDSDRKRDYFARREFSFTIEDDIYIRYQSFRDGNELREAIQKRQPHKIDIGAVFSYPPKDHNSISPESFKTEERELVFDVDMTDYDDIRLCCKGASICRRCWPYMTMALKTVDVALREDFGFQHIAWVYSGRRGIHCWVCDADARLLSNEARTAVVDYLSIKSGDSAGDSDSGDNLFRRYDHPLFERSFDILEPMFSRYIADGEIGQGLLEKKEIYVSILNSLPNEHIRKDLFNSWESNPRQRGSDKWQQILHAITPATSDEGKRRQNRIKFDAMKLKDWKLHLVFTHCYPRLDENVSKMQNHLLKSPFCVHPKTGRVCVTIDPEQAEDFDPFAVPTVRKLCSEVV